MIKTLLLGANGGAGQHLVRIFQSNDTGFTTSVRDHAQK